MGDERESNSEARRPRLFHKKPPIRVARMTTEAIVTPMMSPTFVDFLVPEEAKEVSGGGDEL